MWPRRQKRGTTMNSMKTTIRNLVGHFRHATTAVCKASVPLALLALAYCAVATTPAMAQFASWCVHEQGTCYGTAPSIAVFGYQGNAAGMYVSGPFACNTTTFGGDPSPGNGKDCNTISLASFGTVPCAQVGGTCSSSIYSGVMIIGAVYKGKPSYRAMMFQAGNVYTCSINTFPGGYDPAPGVTKACYIEAKYSNGQVSTQQNPWPILTNVVSTFLIPTTDDYDWGGIPPFPSLFSYYFRFNLVLTTPYGPIPNPPPNLQPCPQVCPNHDIVTVTDTSR